MLYWVNQNIEVLFLGNPSARGATIACFIPEQFRCTVYYCYLPLSSESATDVEEAVPSEEDYGSDDWLPTARRKSQRNALRRRSGRKRRGRRKCLDDFGRGCETYSRYPQTVKVKLTA